MAWLIAQDDALTAFLVDSHLRQGSPLDFEPCPFEEWIMLLKNPPLSNLLDVFLLFRNRSALANDASK
jgi:hypothetical protein